MCDSAAGRWLDMRERKLAATRRCAELPHYPARGRLDVRERKLAAAGVRCCSSSCAFELHDAAARCRLVLRQRRLGAAKFTARTG
jgi:hypothetical protein